jgi:methionine-gamma-lyase
LRWNRHRKEGEHVESLVDHPASMTHATYSADERKRHGISDNLLRLSVGLENVEGLMAHIAQALDHVHTSNGRAN